MLGNPPPIGVVTGPLSPTWVRSMDSVSSFGMYSLYFSNASAPAMKVSHSNFTPVASRMRTVAWVTSGPIPSPGIRVILCAMSLILHRQSGARLYVRTRGASNQLGVPGSRFLVCLAFDSGLSAHFRFLCFEQVFQFRHELLHV